MGSGGRRRRYWRWQLRPLLLSLLTVASSSCRESTKLAMDATGGPEVDGDVEEDGREEEEGRRACSDGAVVKRGGPES